MDYLHQNVELNTKLCERCPHCMVNPSHIYYGPDVFSCEVPVHGLSIGGAPFTFRRQMRIGTATYHNGKVCVKKTGTFYIPKECPVREQHGTKN